MWKNVTFPVQKTWDLQKLQFFSVQKRCLTVSPQVLLKAVRLTQFKFGWENFL